MNGAKIYQQTTKWRHNLEMTSYYCDVKLLQPQQYPTVTLTVRFIQATSIFHFQLEDFEFIMKLNKQL